MRKIKVIIVDDQMIIRYGIKYSLIENNNLEVIGEASNGQEFLDLLEKTRPDVVLMDIKMPVLDGIAATKLAMAKYPDLKILVITSQGDEEYLLQMLYAGVKGYVLKNIEQANLMDAIRKINEGKNYYSPEMLPSLAREFAVSDKDQFNKKLSEPLSFKELEILQLICEGHSDKDIGVKLKISPRTVGGHRTRILSKTGCKNSVGLIFFALKNGLLKLG